LALTEAQQEVDVIYGTLTFKELDAFLLGDLADEPLHSAVDVVLK